jgi:DNA-binding NarL/FixJ family response regulator
LAAAPGSEHTAQSVLREGDRVIIAESPPQRIRILVVDDHGIVREGLAVILERTPGIRIVGTADCGRQAVLSARRLQPDVIIMDLVLPDLDGIEATRQILRESPHIQIIALSACHTPEQVYRALNAGARGYVLKAAHGEDLMRAVRAVSAGQVYVTPLVGATLAVDALPVHHGRSAFESLSRREHEVLRCIVRGLSSADIAQQLSLSRKTIDTYRSRMMVKLGVTNRSGLIRYALQHELPAA